MPTSLPPCGPLFDAEIAGNRDPRLPSFYRFEGVHPLSPFANRVFIMLQDRTKKAMSEAFAYESTLQVPPGDDAAMAALGALIYSIFLCRSTHSQLGLSELVPGDIVYSRDLHGTGQPIDNIIVLWVVGPYAPYLF